MPLAVVMLVLSCLRSHRAFGRYSRRMVAFFGRNVLPRVSCGVRGEHCCRLLFVSNLLQITAVSVVWAFGRIVRKMRELAPETREFCVFRA